jgi:hypothetical protein
MRVFVIDPVNVAMFQALEVWKASGTLTLPAVTPPTDSENAALYRRLMTCWALISTNQAAARVEALNEGLNRRIQSGT